VKPKITDQVRSVQALTLGQIGLLLVLSFCTLTAITVVLHVGLRVVGVGRGPTVVAWGACVATVVTACVTLAIGKRWTRQPWVELLPFRSFPVALLPALVLACVGIALVADLASAPIIELFPLPKWVEEFLKDYESVPSARVISAVVLAPVTEEMVFRGLILGSLTRRYSALKSVGLSSLIFAVAHLNPYQFIPAVVAGSLMGWVRIRSQSLLPGMWTHAVNNAFWILVTHVKVPGIDVEDGSHWATGVAGLALAIVGLSWAHKVMKASPPR